MIEKHVQHADPAGGLKSEFGTGSTESHDESAAKTLLTLSGNSTGTVGNKFHGYDKNEKQNNY